MTKDEHDILEMLKDELSFIDKGGYGRSVRTPWQPKSAFQDSLTRINYADQTIPARATNVIYSTSSVLSTKARECLVISFLRIMQEKLLKLWS